MNCVYFRSTRAYYFLCMNRSYLPSYIPTESDTFNTGKVATTTEFMWLPLPSFMRSGGDSCRRVFCFFILANCCLYSIVLCTSYQKKRTAKRLVFCECLFLSLSTHFLLPIVELLTFDKCILTIVTNSTRPIYKHESPHTFARAQ